MAHLRSAEGPGPRRGGLVAVPQVPDLLVPRARLVRAVEAGADKGMAVVSGPAGSGKTLLLAEWAEERTRPPCWLSTEPEDADPEQFWARVLQAIQAAPDLAADSLLGTLKPPPQFDARFVAGLVDACQEQPDPVVLVLEDLHQLNGSAAMASLSDAIRLGLGRLHLVISTRTDPELPLQRLRLGDRLTEIHADDLAFDNLESAQLLAQHGLELRPEQLVTVLARTEGWAAGLRLAALAIASSDDVDRAVDELGGDHRSVADYFVEEVLDQLSHDLTQFLLDTCVPRRICADLANSLTGESDGQLVLARLERDNLFVVALDDRRSWYRYHHLFGDLLRHRLTAQSPDRARELHRACARWFAAHGEPLESARHLAAAAAWPELARFMIRSAGAHMLGTERHALVEVLRRVPDELVLGDAEVATAAAIASYAEYDAAGVHAHVARARELLTSLSDADRQITEAVLITLETVAAWMEGDADAEVAGATAALATLGALTPAAVPALPAYRGGASVVLGMGSLWTGDLDQADGVLTRTVETLRSQQAMTPVLAVHLHGNLAVLRALQGRLREAQTEADLALGVAEQSGWLFLPQSGMAFLAESLVRLTAGQDDECAEALTRSRGSVGGLEDRFTTLGLALVQARLELDSGNASAARATLRRLRRRTESWPMSEYLRRWRELVELEIALAESDGERVDDVVRALTSGWDDVTHPKPQRLVLLGRAHLRAGRPEECLRVVQPLTSGATTSLVATVGAWVVTALAHDRMRSDAEAAAAITRAVALADAEWIVRPFVTPGGRTRALLERHRHLDLEHHAFVDHLVARLGGDSERRTGPELVEPLTTRERSVLQLLPSMLSNAEIADELFVSVNTVKVHLKALYRKLGVSSRRQAVARARTLGLLAAGSSRSA